MTHRLYINEYNKELVYQLSHNTIEGIVCTDYSTENILVLSGEIEDLKKVCSLMYVEDEAKIKEVLPSFITKEETFDDIDNAFDSIYNEMREKLLKVINKNWDKTSYTLMGVTKWKTMMDMYNTLTDMQRA